MFVQLVDVSEPEAAVPTAVTEALVVLLLARDGSALEAGSLDNDAGLLDGSALLVEAGLADDVVFAWLETGFELAVVFCEYVYPCCFVKPAVLVHSDMGTFEPLI